MDLPLKVLSAVSSGTVTPLAEIVPILIWCQAMRQLGDIVNQPLLSWHSLVLPVLCTSRM